MEASLVKYIKAFEKLRVDRTHGLAPHKPILLLSVLQSYRNGLSRDQRVYITPELVSLFKSNWSLLVRSNHECRISYPFYYLKSSNFWSLVPKSSFFNIDKLGSAVRSFNALNEAVECALLNTDLTQLMLDQRSNEMLEHVLLEKYFPETKENIRYLAQNQLELFEGLEEKILNEKGATYAQEIGRLIENNEQEEIFLRGGLFKREVPKIYDNTCCISGMRVNAMNNASLIDACHIVPFSVSHDDTITNGISLCPNLHRAFDRGLLSIDENYRVMVSSTFEESDSMYSIKSFAKKEIRLPKSSSYFPSQENLHWHRTEVFLAS